MGLLFVDFFILMAKIDIEELLNLPWEELAS